MFMPDLYMRRAASVVLASCCLFCTGAAADDALWTAIKDGDINFTARYRYEHVEDDGRAPSGDRLRDADASTLRLVLGYTTASFKHFSAGLEFEHVSEIGLDDFNNGSNRKTRYAAVVDPDGTEVNQAWVRFAGLPRTSLKAGRQIITYRKAPFHRYLGTVLWRQNWQTMDAVTLTSTPADDWTINYAYVWGVNRIFGDDARSPLDRFDSDSHLVNVRFERYAYAKFEAYGYWLDFDNAAAFSTATLGIRAHGSWPYRKGWKALYALEYAHQHDHGDNSADIDADYYLLSGGVSYAPGGVVSSVVLKANHEVLGGDGGADRFVTILGTNHAFQGWADRFLVTPGDGIENTYIDLITSIAGFKFIASYHMLSSDNDSYDYGDELDLLLQRKFAQHYTVGLKYADYSADRNAANRARNPAQSSDKQIFWFFAQFTL